MYVIAIRPIATNSGAAIAKDPRESSLGSRSFSVASAVASDQALELVACVIH